MRVFRVARSGSMEGSVGCVFWTEERAAEREGADIVRTAEWRAEASVERDGG